MVNYDASDVSGTFTFAIHENNSTGTEDVPGTKVVDLTGAPTSTGEHTFSPANTTTLDPSTKYFVVFAKSTMDITNIWSTNSNNVDAGFADNWDLANGSLSTSNSGTSWRTETNSMGIAIKGEPTVSDDATLSDLVLKDASNTTITLDPTFASDVDAYTETVANAVAQIKVEPAKNDANATIQHLDDDDMELTYADGSTANVFDVDLAEGQNVVKVKVTAEDGTTMETYVITVTRVDFLVSNRGRDDRSGHINIGNTVSRAQQFTTGDEQHVYTISELVMGFSTVPTLTFAFAIHETDSTSGTDQPGTKVVDLTGTPTQQGKNSFTPANPTTLDPSTKYFVVFVQTSSGDQTGIQDTDSNGVDAGTATGWDIADNSRLTLDSGTSWTIQSFALRIAIKGEAAPRVHPSPLREISTA